MNYFKLVFVIFFLFAFSIKANDVQIIELHKNKSLDQLVLEKENNANDNDSENKSINIENANNIAINDSGSTDQLRVLLKAWEVKAIP